MKKMSMLATLAAGMGVGAFLYSYSKKHPIKMARMENKFKDMIKDLQ